MMYPVVKRCVICTLAAAAFIFVTFFWRLHNLEVEFDEEITETGLLHEIKKLNRLGRLSLTAETIKGYPPAVLLRGIPINTSTLFIADAPIPEKRSKGKRHAWDIIGWVTNHVIATEEYVGGYSGKQKIKFRPERFSAVDGKLYVMMTNVHNRFSYTVVKLDAHATLFYMVCFGAIAAVLVGLGLAAVALITRKQNVWSDTKVVPVNQVQVAETPNV
eukprot:270566_1